MAPKIVIKNILFQILVVKVITIAGQSSLKQYLHVTGVGPHSHSAGLANLPTVGIARQPLPSNGIAIPNPGLAMPNPGLGLPNTGLAALSALALPGLIQALSSSAVTKQAQTSPGVPGLPALQNIPTSQPPIAPTSKQNSLSTNTPTGGLDSDVLNNLAIALQLLIVSNILNSNSLLENEANPLFEMLETAKNIPVSLSQTARTSTSYPTTTPSYNIEPSYAQIQSYTEPISYSPELSYQMPNANFLGMSGFGEPTITDPYTKANTRNNYQLMSPYEALGPNSPFSDPILSSPYGSVISSKKDFHSPYCMMDSDPFAMTDLF